jgi:hypothetical protein
MAKRLMIYTCTVLLALSLSACGQPSEPEPAKGTIQEIDGWALTVVRCEVSEDLSATQSAVLYDGESASYDVSEKPQEGNVFVLIQMVIEKKGTGASKFQWDNAYVENALGARYQRHPNDTFLTNFKLPRIKSTDLVFSKNEGYVCYELPADAIEGSLYFVYEAAGDSVRIQLL